MKICIKNLTVIQDIIKHWYSVYKERYIHNYELAEFINLHDSPIWLFKTLHLYPQIVLINLDHDRGYAICIFDMERYSEKLVKNPDCSIDYAASKKVLLRDWSILILEDSIVFRYKTDAYPSKQWDESWQGIMFSMYEDIVRANDILRKEEYLDPTVKKEDSDGSTAEQEDEESVPDQG